MQRAAQYLRMSTEHQNYSLEYQRAHNAAYAAEHGFEIVRTYEDAGVSGLTLKRRAGLKALLADVMEAAAPVDAILVYDVSRWGRFQDPDQGAHYEFLCRDAGVAVIYTAEAFASDGSLAAAIVKQLKRAMAAEYSRELSAKTGRAKRGLQALGFWAGGPPGYGFRRLAVTRARAPHAQMERGEHKALRGHRTILVHGPPHEVETVRRIYRDFLRGLRIRCIAERLNAEGVATEDGGPWTAQRVRQVLTSEKYAGVIVGQKTEGMFAARRPRRPADWLRVEGAVAPIVSRATFDTVQAQFRRPKARGMSDEALLAELRQVLADHGELSSALIDRHPAAHCTDVYKKRFGGALNAYRLAGFQPTRRQLAAHARAMKHRPWAFRPYPATLDPDETWRRLERHFAERGYVSCHTIEDDPELPSAEWYRRRFGSMAEIYRRLGHVPTARQRRRLPSARGGKPGRDADPIRAPLR